MTPQEPIQRDPASFRDPSGFVFERDGTLYRQVNPSFASDWQLYRSSGLFDRLMADGLLVGHTDTPISDAADGSAVALLRPERIGFISYPYEWSFGQLKDAALLTLRLEELAVEHGMTLRDASAYNVQFHRGRAVLIDALSFEKLEPGQPWLPYRQFCEHFLAPLALMAYRDPRLGLLQRDFVDGLPLGMAAGLLPGRTRLNPGISAHLHLHARAQRNAAKRQAGGGGATGDATRGAGGQRKMGDTARKALLDNLRRTVEGLKVDPSGTTWAEYGAGPESYSTEAQASKRQIVERMLREIGGRRLLDIGANVGTYSELGVSCGYDAVAIDADWAAVERLYRRTRETGEERILPLVMDLTNPSPDLGWGLRERRSIAARSKADVVLALALVHHLTIGHNVPLPMVAEFLAQLGEHLIIEWVPKEDPMVQRLLAHRRDIFPEYTEDGFRAAFEQHFKVVAREPVADSIRHLYQLRTAVR